MNHISRRGHKTLALALFFSAFCGHIPPMMLPALAPSVAPSVGITVSDVGAVAGWMTFFSGLAGAVGGLVMAGRDRRLVTAAVLMTSAATTACVGLATSPATFYLSSAVAGVCFGLLFFLAISAVPEYFEEPDRPAATARVTSAMFLASLFGVPLALAAALVPSLSWRVSYFFVSALCGLVCIAVLLVFPHNRQIGQGLGLAGALRESKIGTVPLAAGWVLGFAVLTRLGAGMYITYIPSYLIVKRGFPESGFILTFALPGALAFFVTSIAGRMLADGKCHIYAVVSAIVISTMVLAIVYFPVTASSVLALVLLFSLFYAGAESFRMTALNLIAQQQVPEESRPLFLGLYSLCLYWGYALGAIMGGLIMRAFDDQVSGGIPAVMWMAVMVWAASVPLILRSVVRR